MCKMCLHVVQDIWTGINQLAVSYTAQEHIFTHEDTNISG